MIEGVIAMPYVTDRLVHDADAHIMETPTWLADHADEAKAFNRALSRSIEASDDEQAMRDAIGANTQTPPDVVKKLALANWDAELNLDALAKVGSLAVDDEILAKKPDIDKLIWSTE